VKYLYRYVIDTVRLGRILSLNPDSKQGHSTLENRGIEPRVYMWIREELETDMD
jgi:hypothetical protein